MVVDHEVEGQLPKPVTVMYELPIGDCVSFGSFDPDERDPRRTKRREVFDRMVCVDIDTASTVNHERPPL